VIENPEVALVFAWGVAVAGAGVALGAVLAGGAMFLDALREYRGRR
jgi:hypothetical protein